MSEPKRNQKKYVLSFTKKQLEHVINSFDTYSALTNGVYDNDITAERRRGVKAFDTVLAKVGLKRKHS